VYGATAKICGNPRKIGGRNNSAPPGSRVMKPSSDIDAPKVARPAIISQRLSRRRASIGRDAREQRGAGVEDRDTGLASVEGENVSQKQGQSILKKMPVTVTVTKDRSIWGRVCKSTTGARRSGCRRRTTLRNHRHLGTGGDGAVVEQVPPGVLREHIPASLADRRQANALVAGLLGGEKDWACQSSAPTR
jgi:hypothetical protein